MWSYRLVAPYTFERAEIPEKTPESLGGGQVLFGSSPRACVAAICRASAVRRAGFPATPAPAPRRWTGFPIHEIVGEVVASRHRSHGMGDRVVGWASGFDGMMEHVVADGDGLAPFDPALSRSVL